MPRRNHSVGCMGINLKADSMSILDSSEWLPESLTRFVASSKWQYLTLYSSLAIPSFTALPVGCDRSRISLAVPSGFNLAPTGLQCKFFSGGVVKGPHMCARDSSLLKAAVTAWALFIADLRLQG